MGQVFALSQRDGGASEQLEELAEELIRVRRKLIDTSSTRRELERRLVDGVVVCGPRKGETLTRKGRRAALTYLRYVTVEWAELSEEHRALSLRFHTLVDSWPDVPLGERARYSIADPCFQLAWEAAK